MVCGCTTGMKKPGGPNRPPGRRSVIRSRTLKADVVNQCLGHAHQVLDIHMLVRGMGKDIRGPDHAEPGHIDLAVEMARHESEVCGAADAP